MSVTVIKPGMLETQVAAAVNDLYHRHLPLPERQKGLSFRQ